MKMLNDRNIFTKIMGLSLLLLIFTFFSGAVGYYYQNKATLDMTAMYKDRLLPIKQLNENRAHARAVQVCLFELMVTVDEARNAALKNEMDSLAMDFNKNLADYEKTQLDPFEDEKLNEMKNHLQEFRNARTEVIALAMQNKNAEAYALFNAKAREPMEKFSKNLLELSEYNVKVAAEINAQNDRDNDIARKVMLAVLSIAIVSGLVLAWGLAQTITGAMKTVVGRIELMAKGDYAKDIRADFLERGDEFGEMSRAFDVLNKNMRSMIRQISQSAEHVAASSEELTAGAQQSAEASNTIAQSIQQVAGGSEKQVLAVHAASMIVGEIAASIDEVAVAADEMSVLSEHTAQAASQGALVVRKAVTQISEVSRASGQAQLAAEALKGSSAQIGEIVNLIASIAGQTNLLALNAAIEAARAGEQGKGFAVVADEVRKLAEQSEQAAHEIKNLVANNHVSIGNVVNAIDFAGSELAQGVGLVNEAGAGFTAINEKISQLTRQTALISEAANTAASGGRRIVSSVDEIEKLSQNAAAEAENVSAATEEQSATMQEIAASSRILAELAEKLQTEARQFTV